MAVVAVLVAGCGSQRVASSGNDMAVGGSDDLATPEQPDLATADFAVADLTAATIDDLALSDPPGAPTSVTATANAGGTISLSWLAPSNTGSSALSGYSIQSTPAGLATTTTTLNYTTPALTLGTSYTFDIRASNSFGTGPAATSSAVVAGDVPAAPTNVQATTPSGRFAVTWAAAADNGYAVTNYTVVLSPGSQTIQAGNQLTATLIRLTNSTMYTATVTATNSLGAGPSGMSNTATFNCSPVTYPNIDAVDSASVEYGALVQNVPEPSLYAYRGDNSDLYGWAKFPLATVKSWAQVTGITLGIKVQSAGGSPAPVLEAWYSGSDDWFRNMNGGTGPQPADIARTVAVTSTFSAAAINTFQSVGIVVGNHDWATDIVDGYVTLGVRNTTTPPAAGSSWAQYYSSDTVGNKPYLVLTTCE
jgi:hypothetical protein